MDVGDKNSLLIYKYYLDLVYYTNTLCNMLGGWLKSCLTR